MFQIECTDDEVEVNGNGLFVTQVAIAGDKRSNGRGMSQASFPGKSKKAQPRQEEKWVNK